MMPPPSTFPKQRKRPWRRRPLRSRLGVLTSLLWACVALCALSTVYIHGRLHREHRRDADADAANDASNYLGTTPVVERPYSSLPRRRGDGVPDAVRPRGGGGGGGPEPPDRNHPPSDGVVGGGGKNGDGGGGGGGDGDDNDERRGLSACLLVNDENPRLPEWIAYHYRALPLRSLIVAVDPASRSSPAEILGRWEGTINITIWGDADFLPEEDKHGTVGRGRCDANDAKMDCLWHHRKRQRYFVKRCMAEFKRRNRTWVLLTDVDEYITFNRIAKDDPPLPSGMAPGGVPTLSDWKVKDYKSVDEETGRITFDVRVEGTISGLPEGGLRGKKDGDRISTGPLVVELPDYYHGSRGVAYGNVVEDEEGGRYFLRDDFAFRDAVPMARAPGGMPTLKDVHVNGSIMRATIYDDNYYGKKEGTRVAIRTNWREPPPTWADSKTLLGGHLMLSADGRTFYVERDQALWPPHLSPEESTAIRGRLPPSSEGDAAAATTILDVLEREAKTFGDYANETIGPCLSMPRLLYGSREDRRGSDGRADDAAAPEGFDDADFVTLRYVWHAIKEARANRFQKAIVDVSRLRTSAFDGEAESIHIPLKYYCRKDPRRYSTSFLRVNHYLDSFEAYSYRNDARSNKRQCKECYDEKGREATASMDDDIRPWLKGFVKSVGPERAKKLLAGAGNFVRLT